jgi:hypothetical protein
MATDATKKFVKFRGKGHCELSVGIVGQKIILCKNPAEWVYFWDKSTIGALICSKCRKIMLEEK